MDTQRKKDSFCTALFHRALWEAYDSADSSHHIIDIHTSLIKSSVQHFWDPRAPRGRKLSAGIERKNTIVIAWWLSLNNSALSVYSQINWWRYAFRHRVAWIGTFSLESLSIRRKMMPFEVTISGLSRRPCHEAGMIQAFFIKDQFGSAFCFQGASCIFDSWDWFPSGARRAAIKPSNFWGGTKSIHGCSSGIRLVAEVQKDAPGFYLHPSSHYKQVRALWCILASFFLLARGF